MTNTDPMNWDKADLVRALQRRMRQQNKAADEILALWREKSDTNKRLEAATEALRLLLELSKTACATYNERPISVDRAKFRAARDAARVFLARAQGEEP